MEKKNFFLVMAKFMGIILFIAALIGVIFFKTKVDGSIEFTTDDGTTIHASNYEIRKLDQETDKNLGDGKDAGRKTQ